MGILLKKSTLHYVGAFRHNLFIEKISHITRRAFRYAIGDQILIKLLNANCHLVSYRVPKGTLGQRPDFFL
jgi:hypothetical protein